MAWERRLKSEIPRNQQCLSFFFFSKFPGLSSMYWKWAMGHRKRILEFWWWLEWKTQFLSSERVWNLCPLSSFQAKKRRKTLHILDILKSSNSSHKFNSLGEIDLFNSLKKKNNFLNWLKMKYIIWIYKYICIYTHIYYIQVIYRYMIFIYIIYTTIDIKLCVCVYLK